MNRLSIRAVTLSMAFAVVAGTAVAKDASQPTATPDLIFAEVDGLVSVEAEHFTSQTHTEKRKFYHTTENSVPKISPDGDPAHVAGASAGSYLEILPDSRRNHSEKLIHGENFSNQPGKAAVLTYRVHFQNAGRYYVWVRAYSSGSEDNGLHVGLDNTWPESGQRLQWCQGKHTWRWESKQRTAENHCGEPYKIYLDIDEPGVHSIHFSMREDGFEFDKWLMTKDRMFARPSDVGPDSVVYEGHAPEPLPFIAAKTTPNEPNKSQASADKVDRSTSPTKPSSELPLQTPRGENGDGKVVVSGEQKVWHKITLTQNGPFAHEKDNAPNPFTDHRMSVTFSHTDGTQYTVPGYFAADGEAANSSSESGTSWRAHFAPDRVGEWNWKISFHSGTDAAIAEHSDAKPLRPYDGVSGKLSVAESDKSGRDLRAHGRLAYVGKHYLQHLGSGEYFIKAGADAPETLLAFADFDNTLAGNPKKAPLKTWQPHVGDWQPGDPTWQDGKGKGLIGAIRYLSGKGCNVFSFLTYNAGGDGDNVWPFVHRDDKMHYDCSKLDQWGIVFDYGTRQGMYLHFKMQETENDDHTRGTGKQSFVPESLDGGNLGPQRRLYCRELIARFGHNLALNWNLGEENTQTHDQQVAMIDYIAELDAYDHNIVIHTYPGWQDRVYKPLLGDQSQLTGVSLQNSDLESTHAQTVKWVEASAQAGRPWVVAFDESGSAAHAQCPDLGYKGFDGRDRNGKYAYDEHKVRKQTLWGHLMGGGAGNEYYFGYQFDENDIVCEDWRSRDRSWDYCRHALSFFRDNDIPFWEMKNADSLIGNTEHDHSKYCFAKAGELYLVYLPEGGDQTLDLNDAKGRFRISWFNPRTGGELSQGDVTEVSGGSAVSLGKPPADADQDWLAVVRKQ
ncbi:DUF5060 domain-containing protein [Roseiconus lacunae]|uniref:DUF5060 domain-containing protein n=1 Tax=Roseiconus lacunae TaxID=2605694 RepID=UPI001E530E14|nr:DUF5060 domain-containing protein [Roseiconus lacunae]MCD0460440.1 DUF5060 domain-containing protein [Roseiconus lacunae]